MLPEISKLQFEIEEITKSQKVSTSFVWDFDKWDFKLVDGKVVEVLELDYIKVWMEKILRTRLNLDIYSYYGSAHHNLIGSVYDRDFIQAEVSRMIKEALSINKDIKGIENVELSFDGPVLNMNIVVSTIYGQVGVII